MDDSSSSSIFDDDPSSFLQTCSAALDSNTDDNNDYHTDTTTTTSSNNMNHQKASSPTILILQNLIKEATNLHSEGETYYINDQYEAAEISNLRGLKVIDSISAYLQKNHSLNNDDDDDDDETTTRRTNNDRYNNVEDVEIKEEEKVVVPVSMMMSALEDVSSNNNNNNNNSREYDQYLILIMKIISLQILFWTNQVFVLNDLEKFEESNELCTVALDAIEQERKTCLQIIASSSSSSISSETMTMGSLSSTIFLLSPLSSLSAKSRTMTTSIYRMILNELDISQIRSKNTRMKMMVMMI